MEVGAVKQAFNNEVIHLKKSLNQAKIHTIHKLTRKAKTFNEKKGPDKVKEKLKRKAESAVNEVLIIKKIKPRDVARFIVTHKGNLTDYINKPDVDQNKACARLLLHKALQDKYKTIKDRFGNISINDLLMSRHERRKLKKEMRDKQKEKKKGKGKTDNKGQNDKDAEMVEKDVVNDDKDNVRISDDENDSSDMSDDSENEEIYDNAVSDAKESNNELNLDNEDVANDIDSDHDDDSVNNNDNDDDDDDEEVGKFVRATPIKESSDTKPIHEVCKPNILKMDNKKRDKRKDNKNKNINEKILKRNFNKKEDESIKVVKVVDPFFKTSSGDNYMSLAEPRAPDEVKEVHKQGNRQYRRAVMFGHVAKSKPRNYDQDSRENNQFKKAYNKSASSYDNNGDRFNKNNNFKSFHNNDRKNKFNDSQSKDKFDEKPEKLHPSWEAKKKLSSVLPFQGKKIVFDDS
ncbi:glutamic acid-rich protein-like [Zerene cesonia]|uniref:glutamic acid-rich protein-like n=1 Tax=Zerene cesonia TaxID=33412 RepID=UPI0018E53841|nr:glutamic acid-rich protein-like [Zerene cesonia]